MRFCLSDDARQLATLEEEKSKRSPNRIIHMFSELEKKLQDVRARLESKDLDEWGRHTYSTNPAASIPKYIRRSVNAGAWAKFMEILAEFSGLTDACEKGHFQSLHLCEAPGGFVSALNHYLQTNYEHSFVTISSHQEKCSLEQETKENGVKSERSFKNEVFSYTWLWNATSLKDLSSVYGENFIQSSNAHWDYGPEADGNIMNINNIRHFWDKGKQIGGYDLVTADGSVDCSKNWSEQECDIFTLKACEVFTAVGALKEGGNLVLKMFTFFRAHSRGLLCFLKTSFHQLYAFKPECSKPGNGEVYLICLRKTASASVDEKLLEMALNGRDDQRLSSFSASTKISPFDSNMDLKYFFSDLEAKSTLAYIDQIFEASQAFALQNILTIEHNLSTKEEDQDSERMHQERKQKALSFIARCNIGVLPSSMKIGCKTVHRLTGEDAAFAAVTAGKGEDDDDIQDSIHYHFHQSRKKGKRKRKRKGKKKKG